MESRKWLLWVVLVWLMLLGGWCDGCLEQEKAALLHLKPFFNYYNNLDNWVERKQFGNCCEWERVECNPTTGRVMHLFLNQSTTVTYGDLAYTGQSYGDSVLIEDPDYFYTEHFSGYWRRRDKWYLNASLFLPFQELKSLYLSGNSIAGCQGFERESSELDKLEILDLSNNYLNESILSSISELSSLKFLYLGLNQFTESNATMNGIKKLSKLQNLEALDLRDNRLLGNSILSQLDGFTSLKTLRLQGCGLKGTVEMLEFSKLMNLKELYLADNEIESLQSFQGKGELKLINLEVLGLSYNYLDNSIFSSLGALPNLKSLYLQNNQLTGPTDVKDNKTELGLINLEVLVLWGNHFNDSILPFLGRLSNLKSLSFGGNLNGPMDMGELYALSNLEELYISCELVPKACTLSLQSLGMLTTSLKTLGLNGFSFNGTMTQKWQNLTSLEELGLYSSSFPSNFLQVFGTVTSLKHWKMYGCEVKGNFSVHELGLINLEVLDLWWNLFNDSILPYLGRLSNLKSLSFGGNLNGSIDIREWQNLTSLEELSLYSSSLPSNFLQVIGTMTSLKHWKMYSCEVNGNFSIHGPLHLKNLEFLEISYTPIEGNFLQTIGAMPSLKSLSLHGCGLSGTLPQGFCELRHLQLLDISDNNLSGMLPECFSKLTSLQYLDLSSNQFSGDIAALQSLISLQELSISNNYFSIPSSLGSLFNLSELKSLHADNNTVYAETKMPSLPPRFQLNFISLSFCGDGGSFPSFLYHQHDLKSVGLSNIHFKGDQFPHWLLENNTKLERLFLANSHLSGPLQLPFAPHLKLSDLDISNNLFIGSIPIDFGAQLPSLRFLNMSKNYFNGSIPSSFGDMRSLTSLDLSNNQLSGGIPEHLVVGCSSLEFLAVSNNTLQGHIFNGSFNLTSLTQLLLDGNHFSGMIPDFLSNSSVLSKLDVSNNKLSGKIPRWMGNMSYLEEIIMANNHLEGTIPMEFCQLDLVLLDLSSNSICGSLPSCFNPPRIRQVHLSKNRLQGGLNSLRNSSTLVTLDVSNNHFTGNIPSWIGGLSNLSYLLLSKNNFEGKIPIELCNLSRLSLINLSHNNLSGHIPPCLKLTTLKDVSEDYFDDLTSAMAPDSFSISEPIEFPTKNVSYSYRGRILRYMSGIDLSCNNLVGEIPYEIGNFRRILVLNLSHNGLTGPIPPTFSNLRQIESLDLSHNNLSGSIPPQLVGLYFLSFFNVSYNNLSGKTPEMIAQFGTFDESSYRGNPFLCGEPLPSCSNTEPSSPLSPAALTDNGPVDMGVFYVSFIVSYTIVLLAIAVVLYINPYWRRAWFYRVETGINSCYYFVVDNILPRKFRC